MFDTADHYFADIFRGNLPYYMLISVPLLIMCSSNPVLAANEFTIQRMSQFDVHGVPYGCRASALNLEAKSLQSWKTSRHCIVTRFQDLSVGSFREIRSKAGGLIVLLPRETDALTADERQHIYTLEQAMLSQDIHIPVYFAPYSDEFSGLIDDITVRHDASETPKASESALAELISSVSANGYQIVVSGAVHTPLKKPTIPIIQGELAPLKLSGKSDDASSSAPGHINLPLVVLTAHLDTFGLTNNPLSNVDAAVLLTVIDTFSRLYNSATTAPKFRLMFVLSEAGNLLNYQGTKKWIETNIEENSALQQAEFVLCLDGIGQSDSLFVQVSKPPKEGTATNAFFKHLKRSAALYGNNATVEGVHKKINMADVQLAWEHERFSMKRIPALTLSSLKSPKDAARHSMFEGGERSAELAVRNAKIVAEALGAYVFGPQGDHGELFSGPTAIDRDQVRPWLNVPSMLLTGDVRNAFDKYLRNVKTIAEAPDAREPDFMLYDGHVATLNFYSVKPAVFDLFLTVGIGAYLTAIYFAVIGFPRLYDAVCVLSSKHYLKEKSN